MSPPDQSAPLVWRFPAYLPALGFLVATACAAVNLYTHPSVQVRALSVIVGAVALATAVVLVRMAFVVDAEGLAVRFLVRVKWVPWAEVKAVGVADVRGSETVRILRHDDSQIDVPPSLLQSVRPMSKHRASARLNGIVARVLAQRPARGGFH